MEVELKLALTPPEALERLLVNLPTPDAVITQTNHYFTDPFGLLARDRVMIRVGISGGDMGLAPPMGRRNTVTEIPGAQQIGIPDQLIEDFKLLIAAVGLKTRSGTFCGKRL